MGDFEGGVWAGGAGASNVNNPNNSSMKVPFALGILHTPVGKYALRMANVQTASDLTTAYDGAIPSGKTWGNAGGIALGITSELFRQAVQSTLTARTSLRPAAS